MLFRGLFGAACEMVRHAGRRLPRRRTGRRPALAPRHFRRRRPGADRRLLASPRDASRPAQGGARKRGSASFFHEGNRFLAKFARFPQGPVRPRREVRRACGRWPRVRPSWGRALSSGDAPNMLVRPARRLFVAVALARSLGLFVLGRGVAPRACLPERAPRLPCPARRGPCLHLLRCRPRAALRAAVLADGSVTPRVTSRPQAPWRADNPAGAVFSALRQKAPPALCLAPSRCLRILKNLVGLARKLRSHL